MAAAGGVLFRVYTLVQDDEKRYLTFGCRCPAAKNLRNHAASGTADSATDIISPQMVDAVELQPGADAVGASPAAEKA